MIAILPWNLVSIEVRYLLPINGPVSAWKMGLIMFYSNYNNANWQLKINSRYFVSDHADDVELGQLRSLLDAPAVSHTQDVRLWSLSVTYVRLWSSLGKQIYKRTSMARHLSGPLVSSPAYPVEHRVNSLTQGCLTAAAVVEPS